MFGAPEAVQMFKDSLSANYAGQLGRDLIRSQVLVELGPHRILWVLLAQKRVVLAPTMKLARRLGKKIRGIAHMMAGTSQMDAFGNVPPIIIIWPELMTLHERE